MSHRKRKHRKRCPIPRCPECSRIPDCSPRTLLENVATAFAACEDAGLKVRLRDFGVITREGYVLPLRGDGEGRWVARTNSYVPFAPPASAADDLDD